MRLGFEHTLPTVVFRADRATGECVFQQRANDDGHPVFELIVNGKLLMDSREHASEQALADIGLRFCTGDELEVLVGGLGFGFTLQAVLRDPRVARVTVVELEPSLSDVLARPDVRAHLPSADLTDPRVVVRHANICAWLETAKPATYDSILLDVDNGPESLSAEGNDELYSMRGLSRCRAALRPGSTLAIWSSEPAPEFLRRLETCFASAREWIVPVQRDARWIDYRVFTAHA